MKKNDEEAKEGSNDATQLGGTNQEKGPSEALKKTMTRKMSKVAPTAKKEEEEEEENTKTEEDP